MHWALGFKSQEKRILSVAPEQRYRHLSKNFYRMLLPVFGLLAGLAQAEEITPPAVDVFADFKTECSVQAARLAASPVGLETVRTYYQLQDDQLQWQAVARRAELTEQLAEMEYDGLNPRHYQRNLQQAGQVEQLDLCLDAAISHDYLLALHHLRYGVLDQQKVESYWLESASTLKAPVDLARLAAENPLAKAFEGVRPTQNLYGRLRDQLRNGPLLQQQEWTRMEPGKSLRPGNQDARVPVLRTRLQEGGYLPAPLPSVEADEVQNERLYDDSLVAAVRAFQEDHLLEDDGIVGPATLKALNVSPRERLMQIRINLERLRWFDRYLEPDMLVVDIAGARLIYLENGQVTWRTRTQVGTTARKTPLLKSRITHLTLNPTWTVPPTIYRNDKLPAIRRDLGYLQRTRTRVLDSSGQVLDPATVNWEAPGNIMLRQDAGPGNALGRVAIRFANPFTVYLHDTPSQHLFGRATRTVSSGCVRVEEVIRLLDLLAGDDSTRERMHSLLNTGKTRQFNLPEALPVLLAYWTVEVDADGRLRFRADNYGHDVRVAQAMQQVLGD